MKYIKMLGLAAVAAAAMMAFVGAGTASATVLCENNQTSGCTNAVAKGTVLDFSVETGTSALLKGPFGETIATCTESTVKGPVSNAGGAGATVSGSIETLTFGSCNRPVTVSAPGSLEVHHIAGSDNGTVTSTGAKVTIHNVPLFGSCNYETNSTDVGKLTGNTAAAPTFDIGASIVSTNGCPTGTWSGSYGYTGSTNFIVGAS